jgi:hypothetical protein
MQVENNFSAWAYICAGKRWVEQLGNGGYRKTVGWGWGGGGYENQEMRIGQVCTPPTGPRIGISSSGSGASFVAS